MKEVATYPSGVRNGVLAFDPVVRRLAIGGKQNLQVLAVQGGRDVAKIDESDVENLAFVRDGNALAVVGGGRLRIWDFDAGRSLDRRLTGLNVPLTAAQFESDVRVRLRNVEERIGRTLTAAELAEYAPTAR